MNTSAQTLTFSSYQRQAIVDMGIDAWYLSPLTQSLDKIHVDEAHHALVDDLLETMSQAELSSSQANSPVAQTRAIPPVVVSVASPEIQPKTTPIANRISSTDADQTMTLVGKANRRVSQMPKAIKLDFAKIANAPDETVLSFPSSPTAQSWDILTKQIDHLTQAIQQPMYLGQGNKQADELFIFPPPDPMKPRAQSSSHSVLDELNLSEAEQKLLAEMFAAINVNWADGYATRLLKHATPYGQNPSDALLATHLPILASELALIAPKRVWLLGEITCHSIMQTRAPLSTLSGSRYQLAYQTSDSTMRQANLVCLPTPDYLLALPAEKGKVWELFKSLIDRLLVQ